MYRFLILLLIGLIRGDFLIAQNDTNYIKTKYLTCKNLKEVKKLNLHFCDSISYEINGLYPILDTLPTLLEDYILIKEILINKGFKKEDWESGNWEKGPRFIFLKFKKGDCNCYVYKKYYYNEKHLNGYYNLRVSERIICNLNMYMDK